MPGKTSIPEGDNGDLDAFSIAIYLYMQIMYLQAY
jgi:hypothetical protein